MSYGINILEVSKAKYSWEIFLMLLIKFLHIFHNVAAIEGHSSIPNKKIYSWDQLKGHAEKLFLLNSAFPIILNSPLRYSTNNYLEIYKFSK